MSVDCRHASYLIDEVMGCFFLENEDLSEVDFFGATAFNQALFSLFLYLSVFLQLSRLWQGRNEY